MSSLEKVVYTLLRQANFYFIQEKTFQDLRGGLYRFDFFIPSQKIAIEVQGAQHYAYTKIFHKKRSDFTKAQERDRVKIKYCLANEIKLYCIPYWEIESLRSINDLFLDKFLATSQFHNDNVWRAHQKR